MAQETQAPLDMRVATDIVATSLDETLLHVINVERPDIRLSIHEHLPTVEREWCAFEQQADCTVFQSFGWLSTWQVHIGARTGVRPAVVIGRDARGQILLILPLSVEPRGFVRRLVWLGSEMNDYNAPLLALDFSQKLGPSACQLLWREILELIQGHKDLHFDLIHFEKMPEMVGAQQNPFRHLLPLTPHPSGAYLTHLAGVWQTFYEMKRSAATRRRDRRKRKHLSETGEVKFFTAKTTDEIACSFDTLIVQKTRKLAAMGVGNIFDKPGCLDFYRSLAIEPATRHIAHVSKLDVGGNVAAVSLGLTFRGSYYLVMSGYADGAIMRLSPGEAHLHELMRYAMEAGYKVFDFTIGDEPYKRDWSDTEISLFDHIETVRWRGALADPALRSLTRIKRVIKQTPILWSTFSKARAFIGTLRAWTLG